MRLLRVASLSFLYACSLSLATLSAARAEDPEIYDIADPETVNEIAKGYGSASIDKDSTGDPMVVGRLQGMKYVIYFYGCESGEKCKSIQFSAGYTDPFTADQANEWNKKFRWIKAYAGDGSNFKMDVSFIGGITRSGLEQQFSTWDSLISDVKDFLREK